MKRAIPILLLTLLVQLALVAAVYWPAAPIKLAPFGLPPKDLLPESVDEVTIEDDQGHEAHLVNSSGRWQLPALHKLPADADKVAALLTQALQAHDRWPVAHSTAARQRFQVADYHFQRRIRVSAGNEELRTLYLGTSPGFRKVHARIGQKNAIHAIDFNVFDAPARDGDWIDPRLLQIRTPMRITGDAYSINREGGNWRSGSGDTPDERELLALLSALRSLQVQGVADEQQEQVLSSTEAELVLDIDSLSGKRNLALYRLNGTHFAHSSEYPVFFRIGAYDFDLLTGIDFLLISGQGGT